jgi:hypothetical protein
MSDIETTMQLAADAAAGAISALKRKAFDGDKEQPPLQLKTFKTESGATVSPFMTAAAATESQAIFTVNPEAVAASASVGAKASDLELPQGQAKAEGSKPTYNRGREIRLDQNRKAARESRRRKKVMIEELQRSVIFFSRANSTLKQQNEELTRLLLQAQSQVTAAGGPGQSAPSPELPDGKHPAPVDSQGGKSEGVGVEPPLVSSAEQAQAQAVATQAMFESQGFSAAAARAAAQTMNASLAPGLVAVAPASAMAPQAAAVSSGPAQVSIPTMTPGATMQAMANFQQAAAAAMQAAIQGMQGIPGVNLSQLSATPAGANAQQAYTDTMTALAMQQAAAAAGHQFLSSMQQQHPAHLFPMMAWPAHHQAPAAIQPQQGQVAAPQHLQPSAPHHPSPENP